MTDLTDAQIDALLDDGDGDLTEAISDAADEAGVARLQAKEQALVRAIVAAQGRVEHEKEMAERCIRVAIDARSKGRAEMVAAAREREGEHLEAIKVAKTQVPRLEHALARLREVLKRMNRVS